MIRIALRILLYAIVIGFIVAGAQLGGKLDRDPDLSRSGDYPVITGFWQGIAEMDKRQAI